MSLQVSKAQAARITRSIKASGLAPMDADLRVRGIRPGRYRITESAANRTVLTLTEIPGAGAVCQREPELTPAQRYAIYPVLAMVRGAIADAESPDSSRRFRLFAFGQAPDIFDLALPQPRPNIAGNVYPSMLDAWLAVENAIQDAGFVAVYEPSDTLAEWAIWAVRA